MNICIEIILYKYRIKRFLKKIKSIHIKLDIRALFY